MSVRKGSIAVFITGWDSETWMLIQQGVQEKAWDAGYNVAVFSCFGGVDTSHKHDAGEFNIYRLVNLDNYDGAIIASSTIISKETEEEIFENIKKYDIPTISLEVIEDGIDFGGIDNYKAMRDMVEHFVEFHDYSRFGFVSVPINNVESSYRLQS